LNNKAADDKSAAMRPDMPDPAILRFLAASGLVAAGETPCFERLTGGVSSDIWRVDAPGRTFCVKRALPKLRVAADWRAPVERNANEAAWFRVVGAFLPESVPEILAEDSAAGVFAMQHLPHSSYRNWKELLRSGAVDPHTAGEVGRRLAAIHDTTARSPDLSRRFAADAIFHAIRLEPYLLATAQVHGALAGPLESLAHVTATTKRALVHGDVSPKNILVGPHGPVFLDAECAWWGDPAFDLAFCLNHLLLKALWVPRTAAQFLAAYAALVRRYLAGVAWEPSAAVEQRTARLLPGLFLARVDGKSPVEYVTAERDKDRVRRVATDLLLHPRERLSEVAVAWADELNVETAG
jgi:aminoglycoside phosphotransferase (APT) family kinase protein